MSQCGLLTACRVCAAGDVPVIAPMQPYRGALRASLEQRAPAAVRDFAVPILVPARAQGSSGSSWGDEPDQVSEDRDWASGAATGMTAGVKTSPKDTGAVSSHMPAAAVKQEPSEAPLSDMLDATTALAVLAETVTTAAAPGNHPSAASEEPPQWFFATPHGKGAMPAAPEPEPSAALEAISALAALGTEANSREVVGPDVDFTARELELLAAELERTAAPEISARQQLRKEKIQVQQVDSCIVPWAGFSLNPISARQQLHKKMTQVQQEDSCIVAWVGYSTNPMVSCGLEEGRFLFTCRFTILDVTTYELQHVILLRSILLSCSPGILPLTGIPCFNRRPRTQMSCCRRTASCPPAGSAGPSRTCPSCAAPAGDAAPFFRAASRPAPVQARSLWRVPPSSRGWGASGEGGRH